MPVVLTDQTNQAWCAEDPTTGDMLVGRTGQKGARVLDVLEFIQTRSKQFEKFAQKKGEDDRGKRILRH